MTKRNKKAWKPKFQYETDYNDHFETPKKAYLDIVPILDWLVKVPRENHLIYDPYYCNGSTKRLFQELGFSKIIHEKRDFYKDIEEKTLPMFQTLVTNPPYSEMHKEKCLEFAFSQLRDHNKHFFLLMPNYVAAREYYRRISGDKGVCYLSPSDSYEYFHPEGTGKDTVPFASLWFCGIGEDNLNRLRKEWNLLRWDKNDRPSRPRLATSIDELKEKGLIPSQKRPNPRQRKKRQKNNTEQQVSISISNKTVPQSPSEANKTVLQPASETQQQQEQPQKQPPKSKYRDLTGQRKRKRF